MASVFKKDKRKGSPWFIDYFDETGRRRRAKGCADRGATEQIARKLESEVELRRRGIIDVRDDARREHEARPLLAHLDDFVASLKGKENAPRYVQQVRANVARIARDGKMERLSDIGPARVQAALARLREDGRSLQTVNHSLRHIKQFSRWLHRDGRVREDTIAHLPALNVATDRRHDRRALSEAEIARLLSAADHGPEIDGMSGPDRGTLYRLALGTGLRAGELRSLTPESFDLATDPPTVRVAAGYSKRRREDTQPIREDLADLVRRWLAGKGRGGPVFPLPDKPARMLRRDLEAAGIAYRDDSGRVADFHALRHSFISMLAKTSVPVKVVQTLARHSTPVLTLGRYAHVGLHDQSAALGSLPALPGPGPSTREAAALAATGTDPAPSATASATEDENKSCKALQFNMLASDSIQSSELRVVGSSPTGCTSASRRPAPPPARV